MTRRPYSLFILLIVLLSQSACSSSVLQLRDQLDLHRGTFRQKLADKKELTAKFLACTRQAHDELPGDRRDTGTSPQSFAQLTPEGQATSVRPLAAVIEKIRLRHQDKGASLSILAHVLDDLANESNTRIDVDKLKQVIEAARQWQGHLGLDEDQLEQDSSRFTRTLLTYNKAYFGDLSFSTKPDAAGGAPHGVVRVTSKGFVDRSGNTL
ncbi:MAG: hypothetical protein K8R65_11370, partial [Nitrospirae bacterium]|nr:hypothetical protein [Nitrospirota bacterium]